MSKDYRARWTLSIRNPVRLLASSIALIALVVAGCGQKPAPMAASSGKPAKEMPAEPAGPVEAKDLPQPATGVVNIYTTEPGFLVFIDGEPVADTSKKPIETPCAVKVPEGRRFITLVKDGYRDSTHDYEVRAGKDNDIVATPAKAEAGDESVGPQKGEYYEAKTGEPIPLAVLNSPANEIDPFVTPDGRTIWFISDRAEGKGVWFATRPSPFHPFEKPTYVAVTHSPDHMASPSVTTDQQLLVFTKPEKARISALFRVSSEAEFGSPKSIQFSRNDAFWPAAQILGDGLTLYWSAAESPDKPLQGMTASRKRLDKDFENTAKADLPGNIPCLSADGLRQYTFDGKVLSRALRRSVKNAFSRPEIVANIPIEGYVRSKSHRQFFVSDDEQWLFYSDNPEAGGDLTMVRLVMGRGFGFALVGEKIAALEIASNKPAENTPEPDPNDASKPPPVDPRTLPLPYTKHWTTLNELMAARKYDEAAKLVADAIGNAQLAGDRKFVEWDREDVERVQAFWSDVRGAVKSFKPGHSVRIGSAKAEFVRFENDTIVAKARTREIEKPLSGFAPLDLIAIVEEAHGKEKPDVQLRIGAFLFYDPQGNDRTAEARLEKAGGEGAEFVQRIADRLIHRADQEMRRGNSGAGLLLVEEVLKNHPESRAVPKAKELSEKAYQLVEWFPIGERKWNRSNDGEYAAAPGKARAAGLRTPEMYKNFELRLEFKTQGQLGQGGVFFRWSGEEVPGTATAFKLHLANDFGVKPDMFSSGSLFKVEAPDVNAVLEEGKWNLLVLRVQGEKVLATINGKKVLDTTATSKDIPLSGYIVLDGETGGIAYRRILLIDLP